MERCPNCNLNTAGEHESNCPSAKLKNHPILDYGDNPITFHQWQPSERQFYAAHAMQAILARSLPEGKKLSPDIQGVTGLLHNYGMKRIHNSAPEYNKHGDKIESYGEFVAREALGFADAMVAISAAIEAANNSR